jgi:two-component system sensor histidine kinase RegB
VFAPEDGRLGRQARSLRLNTLIGLRWLAVVGQGGAILISAVFFRLQFPVVACLALVGASAALNIALRWCFPVSMQLSDRGATIMLGYDILQLAGLLFLTGGVANPFVIFFLAPVTIAATSLTFRKALALLALSIVCATILLRTSLPLPWVAGQSLIVSPLYVYGLWTALAASAIFVTLYAHRVAEEARQNASALAAAELVLARAQHLSQIDGLAAAAAHELGTPLATVALVVRELAAHPPAGAAYADDLKLLEQSVEKCRSILSKLSEPSALSGQRQMDISSPMELAEIAAAPHRLLGVTIAVEGEGAGPEPKCARNPGVLYGLGNLIENAVSFAEKGVAIRASWSKSTVRITIADDGRGFPPNILARAGEPYLSQRDGARRNEEAGGGLGLGLFIARSLLERSGATLQFANAAPPAHGAVVTAQWPRAVYEQGRRTGA